MSITVFSQPSCMQCRATYRALERHGLDYEVVDLSVDDAARERVLALGHTQAPVVVAGSEHWSGFRPDLIKKVADRAAAA